MSYSKDPTENKKNDVEKRKKRVWAYRILALLGMIAIILILIFKPCNCDCEKKAQEAYSRNTASSYSTSTTAPTSVN